MRNIFVILSAALLFSCSTGNKRGEQMLAQVKIDSDSPLIPYQYESGEILAMCNALIDSTRVKLNQVGELPKEARNPDNTLLALETTMSDFEQISGPLYFMKYVHPDSKVRDESLACEELINSFMVETSTRKDLYLSVKDLKGRNPQEQHLLNETIKGFEQSGLMLSDDKLAQFKKVMEELSNVSTKFRTNISEDKRTVSFTKEELKGAPEDFIGRLKKDADGKFIVTMAYPDFFGVVENVSVSESRKRLTTAFLNRGMPANKELLEKAIGLRQEAATLLGYKTWADYKTAHGRMATSGKVVWNFLNELRSKLKTGARRDVAGLLAFKRQLEPGATKVDYWDIRYLENQYKKKRFSIDTEKVREYFPSERVVDKMFDIYSQLLGVRFERVFDAKVWNPDVQLYRVIEKKSKKTVAHFYTDFIPREGKYNHAAAFQLRSGRLLANGKYLMPVASIVANFNPPTKDKPSLLSHDEVETLFHEFGHIMHQTLTKAPYGSLSGTNVARDFVEAPSQMLEEWVWSPKMLATLSGHYKDPRKKLPSSLVKQMMAARDYNQSLFYTRQLWLGTVDMTYHSNPGKIDTTEVQQKIYKDMVGIDPIKDTTFEAGFGHLMGYDAGYYGYLWSKVYAIDMFTLFQKNGLLSSKIGGRYRSQILEPGGMKSELDMLKGFLGRSPSPKPFYKKLKI